MDSAKKISCINNLKQIYFATLKYANDSNGKIPLARWDSVNSPKNFNDFFTEGAGYPETINKRQFFGIGTIAAGDYLPVGKVMICPDSPPPALNYIETEEELQAVFNSGITNPTGTSTIKVSYMYGGYFFYAKGAARIGHEGVNIGYNDSPAPYYNSGTGIPATSYYQCRFDATGTDAGNTDNACHDTKGLNSVFYDGHAKWIDIPLEFAATWWDDKRGNSGKDAGYGGQGIWPYVSWADTQ